MIPAARRRSGLLDQPCGETRRCRRLLTRELEDRELVAAKACDDIPVSETLADSLRHADKQGVANNMAQSVVDGLEAVEVEPQHREGLPGPLCAREGFLEAFPEEEPVWKVRQDIVPGRVKDARLGRFPLRHVGVRPNGAAS